MQPFTFFVSYRREDTAPIALLLKYEIEKRLQFVRVSVDVEEMNVGQLFPDRIRRLIDHAHATIALIGKNWMPRRGGARSGASKPASKARPADEDWVVTELVHSAASPIDYVEQDRYGLAKRVILPVFVDCERRFDQFEVPAAIAGLASVQAESIDYASWPVAVGPLIDRIAVTLDLKKRPDADEYPKPDAAKARTQPLPDAELDAILKYEDYEGWYLDNFGNAEVRYLVKTFKFRHFNQAADFMALVSDHCRVLDHHPEWRNVFNHVTVSLTTWDARRRVTIYDLNLALFMNKAARVVSARQ
jgi:4a-hydroxytetrahydrobiopterin dehydratase